MPETRRELQFTPQENADSIAGSNVRQDDPSEQRGQYAGLHLLVDLVGAQRTDDLEFVDQTLRECVHAATATMLSIHLHQFEPNGGISGIVVLAESHISIHSWPENQFAAVDIFMCGNADPRMTIPVLKEAFKPSEIITAERVRGVQKPMPLVEPSVSIDNTEMRRLYEKVWLGELWNTGNPAGGRVLADDFVDHRPIDAFPNCMEGHISMAVDWNQAFPDLVFEVQDVIIEGDKLVGRYRAEGTHLGTLSQVAATGRRVVLTGIDILRFRGSKITDWWHNEDMSNLMRQITD